MKYFLLVLSIWWISGCETNTSFASRKITNNKVGPNAKIQNTLSDLSNEKLDNGWIPIPQNAKPYLFSHLDGSGDKVENQTNLYLFTYNSHLGINAVCYDKDIEHLIYNHTAKDDDVWKDDNLEICISPDKNEKSIKYYFSINPIGSFFDSNSEKHKSWNSNSKYKTKIYNDRWELQILIPFNDINFENHTQNIYTNIFRIRNGRLNQVAEDTGWAPTFSLRGNVVKYFKKISVSEDSFKNKFKEEALISYPLNKKFENKILNYLKNSTKNEAYIVKTQSNKKIILDGNLTETVWEETKSAFLQMNDRRENSNSQQTTFKVFVNNNTLYIGIECFEKTIDQLTLLAKDPRRLWQDDSIELYLMPEKRANREYLQLIVNPKNMVSIQNGKGKKRNLLPILVKALKAKIKTATNIKNDRWTVEIEIPLSAFNSINTTNSHKWAFNITRYRPQKPGQPMQSLSWSKLNCFESHLPGKFGDLWLFGKSTIKKSLFNKINNESSIVTVNKKKNNAPKHILNQNWDFLTTIIEPKKLIRMYHNELKDIQIKQIQSRDEQWAKVKDKKSLLEFQLTKRASFAKAVGNFPTKKSPLNAIETKVFTCKDYEIFTIQYESLPNHYVTGNLYKPLNQKSKMPAIIRIIGHSTPGKRSQSTVKFADHLARHGYAVLVLDSIGQGERIYINQGIGSRTPTSNHYSVGAPMNLVGDGLAKIFIWDIIRGVDFILGKSYVDPEKIILTGSSGGGTVSSYVGALDTRIKGVASVSAMSSGDRSTGNPDAEQNLFNQLLNGCDSFGRIILMAPRPYTIITEVRSKDARALNNKMISSVTKSWSIHGDNKLEYFPTNFPHGYGPKHRHLFYTWLNKYFPTKYPNITKEEKPHFSNYDALNATKTWRMYFDRTLKNIKPIFVQNKEKTILFEKKYLDYSNEKKRRILKAILLKMLKIDPAKIISKKIIHVKEEQLTDLIVSKEYIQASKHSTIPFIHIRSKNSTKSNQLIILINQRGKDLTFKSRYQEILKLTKNNYSIIIPDLCGMGETAVDSEVFYFSDEITKAA
ncbi:MAG: hypothetical protein COA79_25605, partial [Planctomycetota bacterium]